MHKLKDFLSRFLLIFFAASLWLGFVQPGIFCCSAHADDSTEIVQENEFDTTEGFLNILGGSVTPIGAQAYGTTTRAGYGVNVDFKVIPEVGLGGYVLYNSGGTSWDPGINFQTLLYGVQADYFWTNGITLGMRLGLATTSFSNGYASVTTNPFAFGPHLGYDYRVNSLLSIGAELNVICIANTTDISTGIQNGFYTDYSGFLSVKFWFRN